MPVDDAHIAGDGASGGEASVDSGDGDLILVDVRDGIRGGAGDVHGADGVGAAAETAAVLSMVNCEKAPWPLASSCAIPASMPGMPVRARTSSASMAPLMVNCQWGSAKLSSEPATRMTVFWLCSADRSAG